MSAIAQIIPLHEKIAAITLDFEMDYDDLAGRFGILEDHADEAFGVGDGFREAGVPASLFLRTDLLDRFDRAPELARHLGTDFHCHSHTHATEAFDSDREIAQTAETFAKHFGAPPVGYRAPRGVLQPGDIDRLAARGFGFSASVFPSVRPGAFNNLGRPTTPFVYENGLVELPFACVPHLRWTISLSYLKLAGWTASRAMWKAFGLPNVLVFDSHLHDFVTCPSSFARLPWTYRAAWGVNRGKGREYFSRFVDHLRDEGYRFVTMTELFTIVRDAAK